MNSEVLSEYEHLLTGFESVSLIQLESVSLLERQDTKYVFPIEKLAEILAKIKSSYRILEIENKKLFSYESVYYDTEGLHTYLLHHNLRPGRYKIRVRRYVDSHSTYIEIKKRNVKGRTVKNRIKIPESVENKLGPEAIEFLQKHIPLNPVDLSPVMEVDYNRFTLTDLDFHERVTIDINLSCRSLRGTGEDEFSGLVVAEIKQPRFSRSSPLVKALQEENIVPLRISKYCLGILACFKNVKYNRFKKKLIKLQRITGKKINQLA